MDSICSSDVSSIKEELDVVPERSDYLSTNQSIRSPNDSMTMKREIKEESESFDVKLSAVGHYYHQESTADPTAILKNENMESSAEVTNNTNRQIISTDFGSIELEQNHESVTNSQSKTSLNDTIIMKCEINEEGLSELIDPQSLVVDHYCNQRKSGRTAAQNGILINETTETSVGKGQIITTRFGSIKLEDNHGSVCISNQDGVLSTSSLKTSTSSSRLLDDDVNMKDSAVPRFFKCVLCPGSFLQCNQLNAHMSVKHLYDLPYACSFCPAMYSDKSSLISHAREHLCKTTYICIECSDTFMKREDLKSHSLTHMDISVHHGAFLATKMGFQCGLCVFRYQTKKRLLQHLHVHTGEKPFACLLCPAKFARSDNLRFHMHVHTGEKPHNCSVCSARFASSSNLKAHILSHTGEKRYICSLCPAKFASSNHLKSHIRTHTNEKPYNCLLCSAKFARSNNLKLHMRSHTGEKPYTCSFCPAKFASSSNYKSHIRSHTGEKPYSCPLCNSKFAVLRTLRSHIRRHTDQ